MPQQFTILIFAAAALLVLAGVSFLSNQGSLNNIKSKPVGDGQHGTARWATPKEIGRTFHPAPFRPAEWRKGEHRPEVQGLVLGSLGKTGKITALVDTDDIHCLMIGAAGVGKTAFFLYPNLEYACACGMSFLALDTKGDLARNYGAIAQKYYGYQVSIIDLRNPTRSDGFNFLTLANAYMDQAVAHPDDLAARAKAEKYAKILAKTIISPDGEGNYGQKSFFYDSAEGLLTAVILLLAEFLPPKEIDGALQERRHIVSVLKLVQDLLEPSGAKGKSCFQVLMSRLPSEHKARWFAGAALNTSEQAMASVLSLFSAGRSRELTMLPIIQSLAQLEKIMAKKVPKSYRTTAKRQFSVALRPTAKPPRNCLAPLAPTRCSPALSVVARGKTASPSK